MKHDRHECGCVSERDAERWTELCPQHRAEYDTRHSDHLYATRVRELEAEGMTTSDAQAVADAEKMTP